MNSSVAAVGDASAGVCGAQTSCLGEAKTESTGSSAGTAAESLDGGAHIEIWKGESMDGLSDKRFDLHNLVKLGGQLILLISCSGKSPGRGCFGSDEWNWPRIGNQPHEISPHY